jgi:hypothetical protein
MQEIFGCTTWLHSWQRGQGLWNRLGESWRDRASTLESTPRGVQMGLSDGPDKQGWTWPYPTQKNVTWMTTIWYHYICIRRGVQMGTTDSPNKGVHQFNADTPGKRQNVAPRINKDSTLYSVFMDSCTFQSMAVLLTQRSKLWQTIETEKCFWLLQRHLLKILRSFWTSGYERSLVLLKGRVNFRHNTNVLE